MYNCIGNVLLTSIQGAVFGILLILLRCLELILLVRMSNVQTHCNLSNLNLTQNEEYALLDLWVVEQFTQNKGSVWMHFSWVFLPLILSIFTHCRVKWTQTLEYFNPRLWVFLLITESIELKPLSTVYSAKLLKITHYRYSVWMHWFTQFFYLNLLSFFCCVMLSSNLCRICWDCYALLFLFCLRGLLCNQER